MVESFRRPQDLTCRKQLRGVVTASLSSSYGVQLQPVLGASLSAPSRYFLVVGLTYRKARTRGARASWLCENKPTQQMPVKALLLS